MTRCATRAPVPERPGSMSDQASGRTAKGFALILGAARAAGLTPRSPDDRPVRMAGRDELVILAMNDPAMAAAIHSARETLPQFLALARHPSPTMEGFAVKIAVKIAALADNGAE